VTPLGKKEDWKEVEGEEGILGRTSYVGGSPVEGVEVEISSGTCEIKSVDGATALSEQRGECK
jgi:hypothetical protein